MAENKVMEMDYGWREHKREVLFRLKAMEEQLKTIDGKLDGVCLNIVVLKTKAAALGGVAGILGAGIVSLAVKYL